MQGLLLGAVLLLGAAPALAQPSLTPKRDFAADYTMQGAGPVRAIRIAYSAAAKMQRMEGAPGGVVMLMDLGRHGLTMIDTANRRYFEMPAGGAAPWLDSDRYRFERLGIDRVAGTGCTVWRVLDGTAERGTACATDDGIMLRSEWGHDGRRAKLEATALSLASQPAGQFRVPGGYQRMEMPALPPGAGPDGPPRR